MPRQLTSHSSQQFYFVNKSGKSASLSKCLPDEATAVQRHVQTGRKRSRRAKVIQDKNEQDRVSCQPVQVGSLPISHDDVIAISQSSLQDPDLSPHRRKDLSVSPSYQTVLCKQDPFSVTSVPIDTRVAGLLHYYLHYYHPSQWPNEMAVLRQGVYFFQDAVSNILRTAIADKLAMYCLLGAASCRLQFVDRIPSATMIGTEKRYIYEALRLMATRIIDRDLRDATQMQQFMICLGFLNSAEAYRGDMVAAETHLMAAVQVLNPLGGLKAVLDDSTQGQLAMADLFLACVNLRPCFFDCVYDPGSASSLHLSDHELNAQCVPSTAHSLLNRADDLVSSDLRTIIEDLVESHSVKIQLSTASMTPARATQVTHWITLRNMAIRHKLLALEILDPRVNVLRVAIIMWTLLAMNVTGRAKTVKEMAPMLARLLSGTSSSLWTRHQDIKLWIALVGLYCAKEDSEASTIFMDEICKPSSSQILADSTTNRDSGLLHTLEIFQQSFFFQKSVQGSHSRTFGQILQSYPSSLEYLSPSS